MLGVTYWIISGLDTELQQYEALPDEGLLNAEALANPAEANWQLDESGAFFVEYRLQRDRVRSQEMEMLEEILNNPNSSPDAKSEAENLMLKTITLMEQELIIENMIKAQGYDDAIFFYNNRVATVMVKKAELSEQEFVQIAKVVADTVGVERGDVQVFTRS